MKKVVSATVLLFVWTLTTHGKYSVSGDEPHYLIVTQSLLADRDLDLANNYAQNDGRLFGHDHLGMGPHAARNRLGQIESVHDVGLPVLLVVPYAFARLLAQMTSPAVLSRFRMDRGLFTYSIVSLMLIIVTAAGMTLLADASAAISGTTGVVWFVVLAAISPPVLSFAFLIFPEVVALFVTALVVWFCVRGSKDSTGVLLFVTAALGTLPWIHRKYSFYVFGLLFLIVWFRRDAIGRLNSTARLVAILLFIVPQATLHAWTLYKWGNIGGPQMLAGAPFSFTTWIAGLVGLWLDRQSGVLSYAPIYWLLPVCWCATWRRTWPYFVPAFLLYVPMAAFVEWWGGFSPAGRYLTPIIPLCIVPIVDGLRFRPVRAIAVALAIPQILIDGVVWQHPRALWPTVGGDNAALNFFGSLGRAYFQLLPALRGAVD